MGDDRVGLTALVLGGGGARGAYEAGVLAYLYETLLPEIGPDFEFDLVSGTSVGAVHAAYVAATAAEELAQRARILSDVWSGMELAQMLRPSLLDVARVPLRALGLTRQRRVAAGSSNARVLGGLADLSALEQIVSEQIPWAKLPENLAAARPGALCVTCTEVRSGLATVFMDGPRASTGPWAFDPGSQARLDRIGPSHVRASAAIPFLFPATQIGERYFVDGGLRMSTPLSPALRLGANRVLVMSLSRARQASPDAPAYSEDVITQPTFLMGKLLDALMLDPLDYELSRLETVNAWIAHGRSVFGPEFLERINVAIEHQRGVGYRPIEVVALRPSEDLGAIAAQAFRRSGRESLRGAAALLARVATRGAPEEDADFFSYLYFDRSFTRDLLALGRADAHAARERLAALLRPRGSTRGA